MTFTNQQQRIATPDDCNANWDGSGKPGENFRCCLCGHKFKVGDKWRWVYLGPYRLTNVLVCEHCDGTTQEVAQKWQALHDEFYSDKFWNLRRRGEQ